MTKLENKSSNRDHEGHFKDLNDLNKLLAELDDRGLVLSVAAFAEDALGDLLKTFMIPSQATNLLLEGFNAPLGTFSARIKACYSIGLITEEQYMNLESLRKIRNEFAHSWKPITFQDKKISALIDAMKFNFAIDFYPETATAKIRGCLSGVLTELTVSNNLIKKHGTQAKVIGRGLMQGFSGGNLEEQLKAAHQELSKIKDCLENADAKQYEFYRGKLEFFLMRVDTVIRPHVTQDQFDEYSHLILMLSNTLKNYPKKLDKK